MVDLRDWTMITVKGQIKNVPWLEQAPFSARKSFEIARNGNKFPTYEFAADGDIYRQFQAAMQDNTQDKVWTSETPMEYVEYASDFFGGEQNVS